MATRKPLVVVNGVTSELPSDDGISTSGPLTVGTTSPSASAKLQVDSTTQGFLPPRMTTTQRDAISSPATGLVIYNTTDNVLQTYTGAAWATLGSSSGLTIKAAEINTGSTPVNTAAIVVTDATISASSIVSVDLSIKSSYSGTVTNTTEDHRHAAMSWKTCCLAGSGQFTIYIDAMADLFFGVFAINYTIS